MFTFGNNGRFQTLLRESVTFSNFEQVFLCYSPSKISYILSHLRIVWSEMLTKWSENFENISADARRRWLEILAKYKFLTPNNMGIQFYRNSKVLYFLGIKSKIYQCPAQSELYGKVFPRSFQGHSFQKRFLKG